MLSVDKINEIQDILDSLLPEMSYKKRSVRLVVDDKKVIGKTFSILADCDSVELMLWLREVVPHLPYAKDTRFVLPVVVDDNALDNDFFVTKKGVLFSLSVYKGRYSNRLRITFCWEIL